jgi:GNAT superfamily N-acetyltransferase
MTQDQHVTIRAMRREDAASIVAMARELAASVADPAPALTVSDLTRDGFGPERWFDCLVADAGDRMVGYVLFCKAFEAHTAQRRLWIGDLYVRAGARLHGTGRALIAAVARHALQQGCDAVYWEFWRKNRSGEAFFQSLHGAEAEDIAAMRFDKARLQAIASSE